MNQSVRVGGRDGERSEEMRGRGRKAEGGRELCTKSVSDGERECGESGREGGKE